MIEPDDQLPAPSGRGATVISRAYYYVVAAVLSPGSRGLGIFDEGAGRSMCHPSKAEERTRLLS